MKSINWNELATLCCVFLIVWELMRGRIPGAILSILAIIPLIFVEAQVYMIFTVLLTIPVVIEERWHKKSKKDMIRSVLAAGIISFTMVQLLDLGPIRFSLGDLRISIG